MNFEEYKKSVELLNLYSKHYYVLDDPITTDEVYDKLYHKVVEYEENNLDDVLASSATQRVGDVISSGFTKAPHLSRMWSLEDIFDSEGLEKWLTKTYKLDSNISFYCEPKFDGASLNLIYENGELIEGITRGDGTVGELITQNVKTIRSIPLTIDHYERIEIRGEVVIFKDEFDKMNKERSFKGEDLFANPRNVAAGSLRLLDSSITASRNLVFLPYGIGENTLEQKLLNERMEYIYSLGFKSPPQSAKAKDFDEIQNIYEIMNSERNLYEMMLDGMVIKVNEISSQIDMGYTVKNPRWSVAYKFPAVEKITTLKDIKLQIGRSGAVTPVAVVEPTLIDGSTVSRASLYNFDEISRLDLKIGDKIIIIKSGDIIPKIIKVLTQERDGSEKEITVPHECPQCYSELLFEVTERKVNNKKQEYTQVKCQNLDCPSIVINSIIYFAKKGCLNIDGLGDKIVEQLFSENKIKDILSLYYLTQKDLETLDGFKDKKINNLLNSIENSKGVDSFKFLRALGIEHVGEVASKTIAKSIGFEMNVPKEILLGLDDIGIEMAESYINFMKLNKDLVNKLINIVNPLEVKLTYNFSKQKVFNSIFKTKGLGENNLEKILKYFGFYEVRYIDNCLDIGITEKAKILFNKKFIEVEEKYKLIVNSSIVKKRRILEAIENGEFLTIKYSAGSQPNSIRTVLPRNVKDDKLFAYHLEHTPSYFVEKLQIIESFQNVTNEVWFDETISDYKKSNIEYEIINFNNPSKNQALQSLINFTDKDKMNITGLGKESITKLFENNLIDDIKSLYEITPIKLNTISGFDNKKGESILEAINDSKNIECWRFISALGIPLFGEQYSKLVCEHFRLEIFNLKFDDLIQLNSLGYERAEVFHKFIQLNKKYIKDLISIINPIVAEKAEALENPFKGKTAVLTGTMSESRGVIKEMLEEFGAKVSGSVSKKTDFLIYGEDAGSKYDKAMSLGVECLTENEMRSKISESE